jgi:hypothetical protein
MKVPWLFLLALAFSVQLTGAQGGISIGKPMLRDDLVSAMLANGRTAAAEQQLVVLQVSRLLLPAP